MNIKFIFSLGLFLASASSAQEVEISNPVALGNDAYATTVGILDSQNSIREDGAFRGLATGILTSGVPILVSYVHAFRKHGRLTPSQLLAGTVVSIWSLFLLLDLQMALLIK